MQLVCGGTAEPKAEMALAPHQGPCLLSPCKEYPWDSEVRQLLKAEIRVPGGGEAPAVHSLLCWESVLSSAVSSAGNHLCRSHPWQLFLLCLELNSVLGGS